MVELIGVLSELALCTCSTMRRLEQTATYIYIHARTHIDKQGHAWIDPIWLRRIGKEINGIPSGMTQERDDGLVNIGEGLIPWKLL